MSRTGILSLLLVLMLGAPAFCEDDVGGPIRAFFGALAISNYTLAESQFAVNEYTTADSFDRSALDLKSINFNQQNLPGKDPISAGIDLAKRRGQVASQLQSLFFFFLDFDGSYTVKVAGQAEIDQMKKKLDFGSLSSVKLKKVMDPIANIKDPKQVLDLFRSMAGRLGGEAVTERVCLVEYLGSTYYIGFRLISYSGTWKIYRIGAEYGWFDPYGLMTESVFDKLFPTKS